MGADAHPVTNMAASRTGASSSLLPLMLFLIAGVKEPKPRPVTVPDRVGVAREGRRNRGAVPVGDHDARSEHFISGSILVGACGAQTE